MNEETLKTLELGQLTGLLAAQTRTPMGRHLALGLSPSTNLDEINRALDLTTEAVQYLDSGSSFGLLDLEDATEALHQLQVEGSALDPQQILAIERTIFAGLGLRDQFGTDEARGLFPHLSRLTSRIPRLSQVLEGIRGKILPNGEIDDNASPDLRRIRREINVSRNRIYSSLETVMRSQDSAIQDEIVTVRNGRFVIPVRTELRRQVSGVVHGLSSSGQTSYVEPLTVIDQNNDLVRLRELEEAEIANVLFSITEALRAHLGEVRVLAEVVGEVDLLHARARLSSRFTCVRPTVSNQRLLLLRDARHPLLEESLKLTGGHIVPVSLEMDDDHQAMVISGPNAGGKTVVLKTAGLLSLMAKMGLHVPAVEARIPLYEQVFAEIGDHQSIAANLSTFTAHICNLAGLTQTVRPPALILIDEVGTGTDPDEGAALAVAILDFFTRKGATVIATTHYSKVKVWASEADGVLNASVEFDEATLSPTYRLITGMAGASSGLEIARRMNLPTEVIRAAVAGLDPAQEEASRYLKRLKALQDRQEADLAALEEERHATAEKYAHLETEFAARETRRRREFEDQIATVIAEFTAESNRLIGEVTDRISAARLKREADARLAELRRSGGARLRKQYSAIPAPVAPSVTKPAPIDREAVPIEAVADLAAEIGERDSVWIEALGQQGTVETINDGIYAVVVGSLRYRARREELKLLKQSEPLHSSKNRLPKGVSADLRQVDEHFSPELKLIGDTVDEATGRLDKFLDEAFLAGINEIRIVHGHGKGALRRAVAELLTGHPHVEAFREAPRDQGGSGATIASLRQ
ncbi:MAG TPA: endonuclease MutS2 [Blastocatellia bacterium]|nr:endonuclease MutS2 [Blastocatellia bacterium]